MIGLMQANNEMVWLNSLLIKSLEKTLTGLVIQMVDGTKYNLDKDIDADDLADSIMRTLRKIHTPKT